MNDTLAAWPLFHATREEAQACPACNPPRSERTDDAAPPVQEKP